MSFRGRQSTAILLALVLGCAFAGGVLFGSTLRERRAPAFTPTAIALTECRRPEWVVFVSPQGWRAIRWARIQGDRTLRRAYGEIAKRRLEAGCGGRR